MAIDKRAARREFKGRKTPKGMFSIACKATGEVWVSWSGDLNSSRTGVFFLLRNRMHHNRKLQSAWNEHGEPAFEFLVLDEFDPELPEMAVRDAWKERQKYWEKELGGAML